MDRLLNVLAIFSAVLIGLVLGSVRRAHIRVEYSVSWLAAGLALLLISRLRGFQEWMAHSLGLGDAPEALLLLAGGVFLVVLYRLSMIISNLKDSNIALMQRVAILEFYLSRDEKDKASAGN